MSFPSIRAGGWKEMLNKAALVRVLRYPDFRLLWIGAFVSFTGSRIENLAQGYFVFDLTHNEQKLATVTFFWSLPVLLFGLAAGSFSDHFNKRTVLIWTQVLLAMNAFYMAIATFYHFIEYWQIVLVAFLNGMISCIEMPTRQSIVSRVVPVEDLASAVPVNAMTFNIARIIGPAIGGIVLTKIGVSACYLLNAISFAALVWTGVAIKSNLKSLHAERGPLKDIVFEGALYTFRDQRLRTLFILEGITACVGLAYIPLVPAYVEDVLRDPNPKTGLGYAFTAVGLGAMCGLLVITQLTDSKYRGTIIRTAMLSMGVGLLALALVRNDLFAYIVFAILGASAMMQLNTTNALFQLLAPDRLRGRVLAMHIWAINGLSPFGVLFFGWLANATKKMSPAPHWLPQTGVPLAMQLGGTLMLVGALAAYLSKKGLTNLVPLHEEA